MTARIVILLCLLHGVLALAQVRTPDVTGFCPPASAKVDPPIVVLDDLCNAPVTQDYRLQQQAPPLSFKQKAYYFGTQKAISGSALFGAAFFAAMSQVRKDPPEWPQGANGFGRRFGTNYAQGLTKSTAEFLFGFKEDPRAAPPPQPMIMKNGVWVPNPNLHHHDVKTSFGGRLGRALLGVVWTHYDSGSDGVAFSRITGAFASGVVGRAWIPDPQNTWGQVGVRTAGAFGGYAASAVFQEFSPDLSKLFSRIMGSGATKTQGASKP